LEGRRELTPAFGAGDELPRHVYPECLRGFEIDDQLRSRHLLNRQVGRLPTFEDTARIATTETVRLRYITAIAREAAGSRKFPRIEDRRNAMAKRERG